MFPERSPPAAWGCPPPSPRPGTAPRTSGPRRGSSQGRRPPRLRAHTGDITSHTRSRSSCEWGQYWRVRKRFLITSIDYLWFSRPTNRPCERFDVGIADDQVRILESLLIQQPSNNLIVSRPGTLTLLPRRWSMTAQACSTGLPPGPSRTAYRHG